ncbi:MAG: peptide ABC transporter substrate-binding protein [Dehalococcoidia bacterium]|nr:peptide ABC transporter substrate-binding protein [Dehalococcoidia bacterium]
MKQLSLFFAGLALAGLVAVGCGGSTSPESGGGSGGGTGELTILGSDPPTLDPALSGDTESATYVVEIFGGLLTLNSDLQIVPDLAVAMPEVSSDGKTYTFKLKDNAKFHDGRKVIAQDFKYSIERAADPKTQSTLADTYLGDIVGVKDKLGGKANEVRGVTVVDDRTIKIEIDQRKSYFLAKLTYPTAFVVDKANVESSKSWTDKPNGTGAFKLAKWQIGEKIVLERNSGFHLEPAKLTRVNFILAGGSAMTMYENKEIDVTGVSINDIDRVRDPANSLNKELIESPDLSVGYIGFNNTKPPFDDIKVRQAFNYAADKDKIIQVLYKGLVQKANGPLPPGIPGYNTSLKPIPFDPEKAKQLLKESKYGGPSGLPTITLSIPGSTATPPPFSEVLREQWKTNLGIAIKIQQIEWATFLEDVKKGSYQMFQEGWIADYPDPEDFLDILFHSKSNNNNGRYSNPQVDRLLEQARVEENIDKRLKSYQEIEQTIVNEAPWLPLWYGKSYILVKPHVKGYQPAPMIIPNLRLVSIEK